MPTQGGCPQVPLSQNGFGPPQMVPQPPQLWMSLLGFTQSPLQQRKPGLMPQSFGGLPQPLMPPVPPIPPTPPVPPVPPVAPPVPPVAPPVPPVAPPVPPVAPPVPPVAPPVPPVAPPVPPDAPAA